MFSVGFTSTSLTDKSLNCWIEYRDPNSNSKPLFICVSFRMVIDLSSIYKKKMCKVRNIMKLV